jgi:hypothetical protein
VEDGDEDVDVLEAALAPGEVALPAPVKVNPSVPVGDRLGNVGFGVCSVTVHSVLTGLLTVGVMTAGIVSSYEMSMFLNTLSRRTTPTVPKLCVLFQLNVASQRGELTEGADDGLIVIV